MLSMIPALPEIPDFPQLTWAYENGKYCLDEENVDRLLDYGENEMPFYRWEMQQYKRKLEAVLQALN